MVKKIIFILYILVLVCMAAATIVEKSQGTDYAHAHYYGAWWFILIWAVLAALGAFYIIKRKVKCASTLALHLSFIIILAGALLTHISAKRGMIHLRIGQPTDTYNVFIGKVGSFCPIKPGCGGGELLREGKDKDGNVKYSAATGSKGYRWLESEMVKDLNKENDIDRSYYDNLANAAIETISAQGDFEWFVSDDPYIKNDTDDVPWYED